ncbi:MAG TPA: aspartate aminotransferase family protein [Rubrobacter sp.]|nr:aspartate aminotransferase family protein [Rubrobacter sp.]
MTQDTKDLLAKDRRYVWHAMTGHNPGATTMVVTEADGAWVTDVDGNRYLDGMAGQWSVNAGYGREELARAAYEQLSTMPFYPMVQGHLPAIELAERLNGWLDDDYVFFYSNSGSEANEAAFKIARQYHQQNGEGSRWKFVARYRGYHGNTLGALAATGHAQRKYHYEPLAPGFLHVSPPDGYRCIYCDGGGECGRECALKYAKEIQRVIEWELPETVAGVIMEPIITGGGIIIPPEGYVEEVARVCEETGVLLIVDEVICGFGRTGTMFGHQHYGIRPDIVTMAKGITSSYFPLSATAVKRTLFEKFAGTEEYGRLRHINTFGGHPGACAVAIRNLQIFEEENLVGRSAAMGERLRDGLSPLENHPHVGQVRGRGLLLGIEVVEDRETREPASAQRMGEVISGCKELGLIVGKNGDTTPGFNNVITLCPPLNITDDDLTFIVETLQTIFEGSANGDRPVRPPIA